MNKQLKYIVYGCIAVTLCLLIGAGSMRSANAGIAPAFGLQADGVGAVSGVVTAADTGLPIADVSVMHL